MLYLHVLHLYCKRVNHKAGNRRASIVGGLRKNKNLNANVRELIEDFSYGKQSLEAVLFPQEGFFILACKIQRFISFQRKSEVF